MTVPPVTVGHGPTSTDRLDSFGRVVVLGWWAVYLLLSPFYVFSSGTPQPADILLVTLSPMVLIMFAFRIHVRTATLLAGLGFLGWVGVVNVFWWSQYYSSEFLMSILFVLYNIVVLFMVMTMGKLCAERFIDVTRTTLYMMVLLQIGAIVLGLDGGGLRRTGTFNNPNQLGYWSLLIASCVVVLRGRDRLTTGDTIALLASGYIATESLSRAATYSFLVLLCIALAFNGISRRGMILIGIAAALGAMALSVNPSRMPGLADFDVYERFSKRVETRNQQDQDEVIGRGYDRILDHPQHLIFGAGEGEHSRFRDDGGDTEFHSTLGVLLFHYGAIGTAFFALLLVGIFTRAAWGHALLLVPIAMYGLSHQGLRFTMFWIFLGLVAAMSGRGQGEGAWGRQRSAAGPPASAGIVRRGR